MGMHPLGKVSREWSPNLSYAIGLIATDGCLSGDGRHIDFTSADRELVETFRDCLKLQVALGRKGNTLRIQFGDVLFYRWLQDIGLTPAKSLTLGPLKIPEEYFIDFVRGCFDGDGSVWSFWDKRWKNSFVFYFTFSSGSLTFLKWLQKRVHENLTICGHITSGTNNTYQLKYAKREGRILFNAMYHSLNVPHLTRKRKKALAIFIEDPYHNE